MQTYDRDKVQSINTLFLSFAHVLFATFQSPHRTLITHKNFQHITRIWKHEGIFVVG